MKKVIKVIASAVIVGSVLLTAGFVESYHDYNQAEAYTNGVYVSKDKKYVFEDFRITEVLKDGSIRGEKLEGTGEGLYLTKSSLDKIYDVPDKFVVGDEIEVAWTKTNYDNEDWNKVHGIEFLN